jgi:hydrogenase/urease accessory protein HupE
MKLARSGFSRGFGLAVFLAVAGFASRSEAHLVTTGLGPLYDGMGHLLLSPEEWATVAGLALLAGLRGSTIARLALFGLPVVWLVGGAIGMLVRLPLPGGVAAIPLLVIGILVAADLRLGRKVLWGIFTAAGLLHGYLDGVAFSAAGGAPAALLGTAAMVFVLCALLSATAIKLGANWPRIAVRVIGSWLAATGILLTGWALRKV